VTNVIHLSESCHSRTTNSWKVSRYKMIDSQGYISLNARSTLFHIP